jgi:hypothetical protein
MTGTNLFDCLSEQNNAQVDPNNAETLHSLAAQMVASAIASVKTLRPLRPLMFPIDSTPEKLAVATALRLEFEQWVADAEGVYQRSCALVAAGTQVPHLSELNDFIGLTQAMLQVTLESHLESVDQLRRGEVHRYSSVGELRRELQLNRHP